MSRLPGFHGRVGIGERPALVVVDMSVGFTDPESPLACDLEDVVDADRRCCWPPPDGRTSRSSTRPSPTTKRASAGRAVFIEKVPALLTLEAGSRWVEIDPRIAPQPGEPVLTGSCTRRRSSRRSSRSLLAASGCDSVIVTGASTSGCVRATAVDALQHGYPTVVPREAVGDRNPDAHAANLYDIDAKYGDVVSLEEALGRLEELAGTHAR